MQTKLLFIVCVFSFLLVYPTKNSSKTSLGPGIVSKTKSNLHIITIGNNDYGGHLQIKNAENDANSLNQKIINDFKLKYPIISRFENIKKDSVWFTIDEYGGKIENKIQFTNNNKYYTIHNRKKGTFHIPRIYTYNIINNSVTKKNIYATLNKIADTAKPKDIFVFYYGSFSEQDELENTNLYLYGSYKKGLNGVNKDEIAPLAEIANILKKNKCQQTTFYF